MSPIQDRDALRAAEALVGPAAHVLVGNGFRIVSASAIDDSTASSSAPSEAHISKGQPPQGAARTFPPALLELLELVEGKARFGFRKTKRDELALHLDDIVEAAHAARNEIGK